MNESGILPMEFNVIVRPKEVQEKTKGGIYLADETKEKQQFAQTEGELIAISPGAFGFNYPEWPEDGRKPRVGDRVVFLRYQGDEITGQDGRKYWLLKDKAIAGVMADE